MMRTLLLATGCLLLCSPTLCSPTLCGSTACADEVADLRTLGEQLQDGLRVYAEKPAPGWDRREQYAWTTYLKRRAPKMNSRLRVMLSDSKWVFEEEERRAVALASSQWTRAIQELGGLYTELDAAAQGYRRINVSETSAYRNWDRRHPRPKSILHAPSYPALVKVRNDIAYYRRKGYIIPADWIALERSLLYLCGRELVAMQAAWEADKRTAYAEIKAAAEATRRALEDRRASLLTDQGRVRDWMAALQEAEERRLEDAIGELEGEALAAARKLLGQMAAGRRAAQRFGGGGASGYGAVLRKQWAGPRRKLLALLKKQARADEKALDEEEDDG